MRRNVTRRRRWAVRLSLAVAGFLAGMVLIETGLRLAGYGPEKVYSNPYLSDPIYRQAVGNIQKDWVKDFRKNSLSLRGAEPSSPRMIALGDSCTAGCFVPEPETYVGRLATKGVETMNAGVPGHSTYQGLRMLRQKALLRFHPKLVTIYYGWNDHWRAAFSEKAYYRLRLLSPYSYIAAWLLRSEQGMWDAPGWTGFKYHFTPRVPMREYRDNLRQLVEEARAAGAVPVLITAPIEPGMGPPEDLMRSTGQWAEMNDHHAYVRATREVAAETGAGLVDFAAEYERRKTAVPSEFFHDFVHPNGKGHAILAGMLRPWLDCALSGSCPPVPATIGGGYAKPR